LLIDTSLIILSKKLVKTLKMFQFVSLDNAMSTEVTGNCEAHIFGKSIPLLHRLAGFLMDAYKVE
jgi:hypothetical protein